MLPERIARLRETILDLERIKKIIPRENTAYQPDAGSPPILRHAGAYAKLLDTISINHLPGEEIVGNNLEKYSPRPEHLIEDDRQRMRRYPEKVPAQLLWALEEEIFYLWAWSDGHILPMYEKVLKQGADALVAEIRVRLRDLALNKDQREFLEAALQQWEAGLRYVDRHAAFFRDLASQAADDAKHLYYQDLAELCERVPRNPAASFRDALQSLWFTFILGQFDDCSNHSLGRLDQYLFPYYIHDISSGVLTREKAKELFMEFWLKFNLGYRLQELEKIRVEGKGVEGCYDPRDGLSWLTLRVIDDTHPDIGQTLDVCGLTETGEDATNELSWLVLEAVDELRVFEPKPVVKLTEKTDRRYLQKCCAINASGFGLPSFSYHRAGEKGLRAYDGFFAAEDIRDHSHIGCVEIGIPGKSYTDPMNGFTNLPKIVLVAMNGGYLNGRLLGSPLTPGTTWESFWEVFRAQLDYFVKLYVRGLNDCYPFYAKFFFRPFVSTLVEDCVAKALPVDSGGAKYWVKGINSTGFATAVNSLYAIKRLVYEESRLSLSGFSEILARDYQGHEDLWLYIRNRLPKYGNGVHEVDALAADLARAYSESVRSCRTHNGGRYRPGLYSFYGPIKTMGKATGATPDGRKAGEVLSLNSAPAHGTIKNGLSAALHSVSIIDHTLADNASTVDVQLTPGVPCEVIQHIVEYLATKEVLYVQFSVVDRNDLIEAQLHPELYQDLIVRVTGFSARFLSLPKETQDEIIQRSFWR